MFRMCFARAVSGPWRAINQQPRLPLATAAASAAIRLASGGCDCTSLSVKSVDGGPIHQRRLGTSGILSVTGPGVT
jgi:hypothetical protein